MTSCKLQVSGYKSGFTIIEALVFLFIFAIITVTFYATWSASTRYILLVKNRFIAISLANEKMEVVRNLAYDKIAHTGATPPGNLRQEEYITRMGKEFHVRTRIRNEDDPLDGTLDGTPKDVNFVDYKNVRIEVSWDSDAYNVTLASRFVPPGIESSAANLGVLVVNVYSDQSKSNVSGSTVLVTNAATGFHETDETDNFGRLMLVGLPESTKKYQVTLAKSGYEAVATLPPYPATNYNPTDTHASVIKSAVNTIDIIQNKTANLKIKTTDYLNQSVAGMNFYLKGGRVMGTTVPADPLVPGDPKYKIDEHAQTEADGEKDYDAVSPGQYEFTLEKTGYTLIGLNAVSPFLLASEQTLPLAVKVSPNNVTALLINVKKDLTTPIAGASVHLTNIGGYNTTLTTDANGMVFFPNVADPPFAAGPYNFSITAAGYKDVSDSVTVTAGSLETKEVVMTITP
jgi:type II secretory pathway pseudopilin PulG